MLEGRCSNNYRRSHIDSNATSTNPWIGQRQHPRGAPTSNAKHAQREVRSSNCFDHPDRTDRTPEGRRHPNGTRRKDRNPADETSSTPKLRCQLTKVCAQTPGANKEKHAMAAKRTRTPFSTRDSAQCTAVMRSTNGFRPSGQKFTLIYIVFQLCQFKLRADKQTPGDLGCLAPLTCKDYSYST